MAGTYPADRLCHQLKRAAGLHGGERRGQRVAMLRSTGGAVTCSEPAGRALSVGGPAWTCSTLQGDHAGFGTTPADLEKCARSNFKHDLAGVSHSVTLDGRPTRQVLIASGVFYVPKVVRGGLCSSPCVAAPTAHAAGYGYEVLLSGLSKGTHIIDFKVASFAATVYTIDVR